MDNKNNRISYFKIGSFVLVGIGLIVFALLIFGSSRVFEPVTYIETYFEESIQGITEGSPVKYRGLQVGYVKKIAFTSEVYVESEGLGGKSQSRSIYVMIAVTSKLFTNLTSEGLKQFLDKEIANGLRVKLVAQGLTGISYLEFDYIDPKDSPLLIVNWSPKVFYIPSVTSTLTRLSENTQYIINELKDINFKQLFLNLSDLSNSLNRVANKTENLLNNISAPAIAAVQNLKIISDDLRVTSRRIKLKPSELIFGKYPPPLDPEKL